MSINHESIEFAANEFFRVLRWDKNVNYVEVYDFEARRFVPMKGVGGQWHVHEEMEITLLTLGTGIRVVGDDLCEISSGGNLVLIGRGLPHYWKFEGPSAGICVQWDANRLMNFVTERARLEVVALVQRAAIGLDFSGITQATAAHFLHQLAAGKPVDETGRLGVFLQLIGVLIGAPATSAVSISSTRFDGKITDSNYLAIQQAIDWIMSNFQTEIRLEDVLAQVEMSKASFSRHFANCTGQSFVQFLNEVRISHACQMIHTTQKPISVIADESGFNNLSNFNRVFLKRRNVSPSDYRKLI